MVIFHSYVSLPEGTTVIYIYIMDYNYGMNGLGNLNRLPYLGLCTKSYESYFTSTTIHQNAETDQSPTM